MFKCIVVPLDGSDLAEQALPYAAQLANASGGRLVLHRACPTPDSVEIVDARQYRVDSCGDAETYLAAVAVRLGSGLTVTTTISWGYSPAEGILRTAAQESADAIVMATHGRSGMPHLLYGSVTESVLATSNLPVFVVRARPGTSTAATFDPVAARILVPLDGSAFAQSALHVATDFLGTDGELVLACVVQPPDHIETDPSRRHVVAYLDQLEEARTREAREYLRGVARGLQQQYPGIQVSPEVRIHHDAIAGILAAAAERGVDLVVMATHGRTGLRRAVTGSVAGGLLRDGSVPVLLVGPAGADAALVERASEATMST